MVAGYRLWVTSGGLMVAGSGFRVLRCGYLLASARVVATTCSEAPGKSGTRVTRTPGVALGVLGIECKG